MDTGPTANRTAARRQNGDDKLAQPCVPIQGGHVPLAYQFGMQQLNPLQNPYALDNYNFAASFPNGLGTQYTGYDSTYNSAPNLTTGSTNQTTGLPFENQVPAQTPQTLLSQDFWADYTPFTADTQSAANFSSGYDNTAEMPDVLSPGNFTRVGIPTGKRMLLENSEKQLYQPEPKQAKLSSSNFAGANSNQGSLMQELLNQCEKENREPTEKEMKGMSMVTKLSVHKVTLWFGHNLQLKPKSQNHDGKGSTETDAKVKSDIENYIATAKAKLCSTAHSRKSTGGKYSCTWNCGYSIDTRNSWERHEEKKQPQEFWHCTLCRSNQRNGGAASPFITHRSDKFRDHAKARHGGHCADDLRHQSRVMYNAPFERKCTYVLKATGEECGYDFDTWKERNDHYVQHFHDALKDNDENRFDGGDSSDDEDDDLPRSSRRSRGKSTSPTFSIKSVGSSIGQNRPNGGDRDGSTGGDSSQQRRSCNHRNSHNFNQDSAIWLPHDQAGQTDSHLAKEHMCYKSRDLLHVDQDSGAGMTSDECRPRLRGLEELAARWLIDVESHSIIRARPQHRYLALRYPDAVDTPWQGAQQRGTLRHLSLPPLVELQPLFQKALDLTKEMGFQYLWIDVFCEFAKPMTMTDLVYRQANLILIVGYIRQSQDQIWHFTCDYTHLHTVESWIKQSVSFHHLQQLGHGAYSVVDKVQLRPTNETFARKIVFRTTSKRPTKTSFLQEIEIMQKFKHPHIASFVAAYYDRSAFNILMSPVAECDLRQFLSRPEQFSEQLKHLEEWFVSLSEALAYMHGMRCRHKDLKPANILISGNKVLLTDFGTSYDFSTTRSTSSGSALMTPKYCAPEVAARDIRGRSADIWSLGCVFAEMITVALGRSLDNMHSWLEMDEESADHHATYHEHLDGLHSWLWQLGLMGPNAKQRKVLEVSSSMLERNPKKRPKAAKVHRALCSNDHCSGVSSDAKCHCCPCQASATSTALSQDLENGNSFKFLGFLIPASHQETFLTMAIMCKTKSSPTCSEPRKVVQGQVAFVFVFRPRRNKSGNGCPFLEWINLVRRIGPKAWEQGHCRLVKADETSRLPEESSWKCSGGMNGTADCNNIGEQGRMVIRVKSVRARNRARRFKANFQQEECEDKQSAADEGHLRKGYWSTDQAENLRKELKALAWRGGDTSSVVDAESKAVYKNVVAKYGTDVEPIAMAPI